MTPMKQDRYTLQIHSSIRTLEPLWRAMEAEAPASAYYQGYTWNRFLHDYYRTSLYHLRKFTRVEYAVVLKTEGGGSPLVIAPLMISLASRKVRIDSGKVAGRLDFLTAPDRNVGESVAWLLDRLTERYAGYRFEFFDIPMESPLAQTLLRREGTTLLERESYCIPLSAFDSYESYFASLGKQARQNVRTARNRLATDSLACTFRCYGDGEEPLTPRLLRRVWSLYLDRSLHWKHKEPTRWKRFTNALRVWVKTLNSVPVNSLRRLKESRLMVLEIDGRPAAFLVMYLHKGHAMIPKLAIDPAFSRYSPGILLVMQAVEWSMAHGVGAFDLSRGGEPYKRTVGGVNGPIGRFSFTAGR